MLLNRIFRRIQIKKDLRKFKSVGKNFIITPPYILRGADKINIADNVTLLPGLRMAAFYDKVNCSCSITIGSGCYFCYRLTLLAGAEIDIGENVLIGSDVSIISYNHGICPESNIPYKDQKLIPESIKIGDNCWIGDKVVITAGSVIGKGCVIGAGSVVTKEIPDFCIAVGSPARVIKKWNFTSHQWEKCES